MSDLETRFETAREEVQTLPERPDNETLLALYSLFKQGTVGDVQGKRPGMLDFVGRAKYDAWEARRGTSREAAMQEYIDLVERLKKG
ncbi:MAG: acyl-CoA-binding protein [Polyangia bacterium]|jgi:acyl-CoA-binding protein|nr:acyl-CoA-binding protein [Polyangia bacterium]